MTQITQRVEEASALRRFFDEQWEQLERLYDDYRARQALEEQRERVLADAVESIVDGTDRRLRILSSYQKTLRQSAHQLLEYVEEIVGSLPPALTVSRKTLATDPLVRRLVRDRDQIHELFDANPVVQEFFASPEWNAFDRVYGLMFLSRYEKTVLGTEVRGDMLIRGVKQTAVNFTSREVTVALPSEGEARKAMKKTLFDSVIAHIRKQTAIRRHGRSPEEKLAARLNPEQNLDNPEVYLHYLTEWLSAPQQLLQLSNNQLSISKMGIITPVGSSSSADLLNLYEVAVGDQESRVVSIVSYPRAEFEAAG